MASVRLSTGVNFTKIVITLIICLRSTIKTRKHAKIIINRPKNGCTGRNKTVLKRKYTGHIVQVFCYDTLQCQNT